MSNEFIGNDTMIKSLKSLVKSGKIPHTMLFYGPYGCGKTTLAEKMVNYIGAKPSGTFLINSSNDTGVDTARDIIHQAMYMPLEGEKKVYILDEVHNTSKQFQDALLDITDPNHTPEHLYFILCTTDPQKIKPALLSRCKKFQVKTLKKENILRLLAENCEKENVLSDKILDSIYNECSGIPRDALEILEKIKDIENADEKEIIEFIQTNIDGSKETIDLIRALKNGNWKTISEILKRINDEPEGIRRAIIGYYTKVLLNNGDAKSYHIIECMKNNFYDSGKAGLVASCYRCVNEKM